MGINTYNLQSIKKELQHLSATQISDLCLRLAKYKKENKELLAYLLFEADDDNAYTGNVKQEIDDMFAALLSHSYYAAKGLRKILKVIGKHVKFMASKPAEIELLLHYCENYLAHIDRRTGYKPLRQLLLKPLEKTSKLIGSLHEDLQFDYQQDYEHLLQQADEKLSWLNKRDFM
ncbi:hypothetical protein KHS38_11590 [Mucilaginibacter sp. Bleaf8]|uniref:hypothetical protein n=1 Tax=Mucilaginibacter sp. Bleaf8 TaxID=2834430 RepID=UPI001BCD36C5|nr:hypothetical protein [Mucilaginibacter sp. Bleaf8]MBS7565048.1 hypothetical protein [Mucilaginibacter sp. Bleaf8]